MFNTDFEYLIGEYMVYCKSRQLREKTWISYEQALRLFERWCNEEMKIFDVLDITESVIRKYINDTMIRGKYTFYTNDNSKDINYPDRRRDFQKPVSNATINNYIRNLRAFFNWLDRDYVLKKNPMEKIRQLKNERKIYQDSGADALMLLPPFFMKPGAGAIYEHMRQVCRAVDIPVVVQYAPEQTGVTIAPQVMANLRNDVDTQLYYKIECKPAGGYISELLRITDNSVKVFIGNAGYQFIECFDRGAIGAMPGGSMFRYVS